MPLLKFDLIKGRSVSEIEKLLEVVHGAVVRAFNVPSRDRYQIVTQHEAYEVVAQDTGLGFERSLSLVVLTVITSPRSDDEKLKFIATLSDELSTKCGLKGEDLLVTFISNKKGDWSFAHGRAQYTTGEL